MRVALFSRYPSNPDSPRGGVEAVTVVLARALAELGDLDLHVVTLERTRQELVIEADGPIQIHRLGGSDWPQIADILFGPGRKKLIDYLLSLEPDVIHSHETYGLMFGTLPVPHVLTVHGFDHENLPVNSARFGKIRAKLWRKVERRGLAGQQTIISITPYVQQKIEPLTKARIYNLDNPVDKSFFNIRPGFENRRVLVVGWLSQRKNTLGAIRAFAIARARGVPGLLALAGQAKHPAYHKQVLSAIRKYGLEDSVELLGQLSHERLMKEFARSSVLLLPSRQENAPMAIAEAMAAGLPVIASNRCGMPFMVRQGQTGFLIDPEDCEQIAERLGRLLNDPSLAERMGKAGRQVAREKFHPRAVALATRKIYRTVCKAPRHSQIASS